MDRKGACSQFNIICGYLLRTTQSRALCGELEGDNDMLINILNFILGAIFGVCALAIVSINQGEDDEIRKGFDEKI